MGVLVGCTPRKEVLEGDLDDSIFAADFGDLLAGNAPDVYKSAEVFFRNTHPAAELRRVVQAIFGRLASPKDNGATVRLSTGFGGGKTHTLMTLWHLANHVGDLKLGNELLPAAGRPKQVTLVAVDASKAGLPIFASRGKRSVRSLWGDIFWQLGQEAALKILADADDPEASPNDDQLRAVLPNGPLLFLLDELVIYMARLSERGQKNLLGFVNLLAAVTEARPQTVLVVTDPGSQSVYSAEASQLGEPLVAAAADLDQMMGRRMTDFDPIGDEGAQVISRRLLEQVDPALAQQASKAYYDLYERVARDEPGLVPTDALSRSYAERIVQCYPFHPRLLNTAQDRLGALQDFQRSRGVLRLFARILRDVWEAGEDVELIGAGEVNWSSSRIQADLLQRLNRDGFKAAVSADVEAHASEWDGGVPRGIHRRVASALLLESLPLGPNCGLDRQQVTLAALRPDEAGPEPSEALDDLIAVCWHTYPLAGGRGWQFQFQPNIIKQIEERKALIPPEDAKSRVLAEVQGYFQGAIFKSAPWPTGPRQVPPSAQPQLALCDSEAVAQAVCALENDDPTKPMPRTFQNAIVAVAPSAAAFANAVDRAQRLLAAEAIERENRSGDGARLVREQLGRLKPDLQRQFCLQAIRAFDRVVLASGRVYPLEEKYQGGEEQLLKEKTGGQAALRRFLEDKRLVYGDADALDVDLFVTDVLPGATPLATQPEVWSAKAVHERFLSAPGLRLVRDQNVVRRTLLGALEAGKIVVRLADDRAYDSAGCVQGKAGARHRVPDHLTGLPLDDTSWVTLPSSTVAGEWLHVDSPEGTVKEDDGKPPPPPPPPRPGRVHADSWDRVRELATERPLESLTLRVTAPAAAAALASLAQPLGAERLALSVTVQGEARDGGTLGFRADDVKQNHSTKPLAIAQTIYNALAPGADYEAVLSLEFGAGRGGLADSLATLATGAPNSVEPMAWFGPPWEGAK